MQQEGRLVIHAGRLVSALEQPGRAGAGPAGTDVTIRQRRSGLPLVLRVDRIVNAIGPGGDVRKSGEPLLDGLLRSGLASADPFGLGLQSASDGSIVGADGLASTRISTLGSPRRGDLWESTAVPEVRVQAHRLAARLIADNGRDD